MQLFEIVDEHVVLTMDNLYQEMQWLRIVAVFAKSGWLHCFAFLVNVL
jgi:hypothetical protein